ncbi:MAG TPA: DUF4166 domain-containing protein [Lysobacter sp.]
MTTATPQSLYRQLLAARFDQLPPTLRALHDRHGCRRYHGKVEVDRGAGVLSRLCAWAARLPAQGRGTIKVEIDADAKGERWARVFAGRAMRSRLWAHDALLRERLGLLVFAFRLDVEHLPGAGSAVVWHVASVSALGLPLPRRWFTAVTAREYERDHRYRFDVAARLPWIGLLVHYRGWLDVD